MFVRNLVGAPPAPLTVLRPNPNLGAGFFWYTAGNSRYNALQFEVNRRLSQRLQFRANYTWAKNLDMNSALTIAQAQNQPQDHAGQGGQLMHRMNHLIDVESGHDASVR